MTSGIDGRMFSPWEEEGRRQALALDPCSFVLVMGDEPRAAAEVALGMGRLQAARRRVIVADGVGLLSPIDDLVPFDSPRGIGDVFVQGAPIEEVSFKVDTPGDMRVLPGSAGVLDHASLYFSEKWPDITDKIRDAEALLILVAPEGESSLEAVLPLVDGVVLVGRARPLANVRALAYVPGPGMGPRPSVVIEGISDPARRARRTSGGSGEGPRFTSSHRPPPPARRAWAWPVALVAAALAIGGGGWWRRHATASASAAAPAPAADSASLPAVVASPPESASTPVAAADSAARSSAWAILLGQSPSATAANARLTQDVIRDLPAVTYAPADDKSGNRVFRLIAGAYMDSTRADSLLAALRTIKTVAVKEGAVVRLPYAVLVQSGLTRDDASLYMTGMRNKGLPVYALAQDDGTIRLYAGAFEHPADAELLVATVRANGEQAGVTYRTGRAP